MIRGPQVGVKDRCQRKKKYEILTKQVSPWKIQSYIRIVHIMLQVLLGRR